MPEQAANTPVASSGQENDGNQESANANTPNETPATNQTPPTPTPPAVETPEKTYTKAEVDAAAAAARRDEQSKSERAKAQKNGEFETLYKTEESAHLATRQKLWRERAIRANAIPEDWQDTVTGSTEEEINDSAKSLKKRLDKLAATALAENKNTSPGTPPAKPGEGSATNPDAAVKVQNDLARAFGFSVPRT